MVIDNAMDVITRIANIYIGEKPNSFQKMAQKMPN